MIVNIDKETKTAPKWAQKTLDKKKQTDVQKYIFTDFMERLVAEPDLLKNNQT